MGGYWQAMQRARVSRRRLLAGAAMGAGALAAVTTLGGVRPPLAWAGDGPRYGGTYRFPITGDFGTIDPLMSVAFGPAIIPRIYNTLIVRSTRQPDIFLFDLAESFEQPDDETYLFSIRPGVRIAPNVLGIPQRAMNASDVVRWAQAVSQSPTAVLQRTFSVWIDSFEAPDADTFVLRTNGPYAYLFFSLGSPVGGYIPPRDFFDRGLSMFAQGAGAGPFGTVISFSETDGAVLQRNPNYYVDGANGGRLPYVDRLEALRITDRQPRRTAFVDRQIEEYDATDHDEVDALLKVRPGLQVAEGPTETFISFVMNPTRPPWNDERLRRAASLALNRQEYVDVIVGANGGRPNGLVPWYMGDYALPPEELAKLQPHNPELARQLIMEATGNDSITINVMYPANSDIEFHNMHLPIFLEQMHAAGFNVSEEPQEFTFWLLNYQNVNYDASLALNQIYGTPEVPLDFHSARGPTGDDNYAIGIGALFPEIDDAIRASKQELSPPEQIERVRTAQRVLYEHGPAFLPIMSWIDFTLYQSYVRNPPKLLDLGTNAALFFSDFWLTEDAPRPGIFADASCDGALTSVDAALSLQTGAGLISSPPCGYKGDVNRDGRIDAIDAALQLQRAAGLIPPLE